MANDVVLGAAMRSNLLSLQSTQRSIDSTQLRLATGKKINSALDGPQSFFTAQSLNNRASDLTRLLDGIGQSIRTIEEADKGVTALTSLVEQADSIVSSARDELAAADGEARMVGTVDLRQVNNLVGFGTIALGDDIQIVTTNDAGLQITETFDITAGLSAGDLVAQITDRFADVRAGEIVARLNETTGFLEIESKGGRAFRIGDGAAPLAPVAAAGYTALGIGRYFEDETRTFPAAQAGTFQSATIIGGRSVSTISLYESAGNLVDAGDVVAGSTLTRADGTIAVQGILAADTLGITINNTTSTVAVALSGTWQDVVDSINQTAAVSALVRAEFDSNSGTIKLTSLSDTVENIGINFTAVGASATRQFDVGWGGNNNLYAQGAGITAGLNETILALNSSTQALDGFAKDFNTIRDQINDLVKDANYRGVNLLNGDNLTTFFNEDNTSSLTTEGAVFTSDGLGLAVASFTSSDAVERFAGLTRDALNEVRSFGASLANNLSIIQTRQSFTEQTINTLKAGASDLTDADLNEEGANLLALQTAQQLGVTALSLASQSQQSVLRLF